MVNNYIFITIYFFVFLSTYKYHLDAWGKTQQTLDFSLKTVVFIRFGDPSLDLIDLTGCCILGEKHI